MERRVRWCAGCAKVHGAVNLINKKCETCKVKCPSFGLPLLPGHGGNFEVAAVVQQLLEGARGGGKSR